MKARGAGGEVLGIILALAGTLWVVYWQLKVLVFALLHPLQFLGRLLPLAGCVGILLLLVAVFFYARLARRRAPRDPQAKLEYHVNLLMPAMRGKTAGELLTIVTEHDTSQWSEAAIIAAQRSLKEKQTPELVDGIAEFRSANGI